MSDRRGTRSTSRKPGAWRRLAVSAGAVVVACLGLSGSPRLGAVSSMGTATVVRVDGRPCFSVAPGAGPDLHLFGVRVVDTTEERADALASAGEVWGFLVDYPGVPFRPDTDACVSYGRTPAGAHEREAARPLVRDRIYRVSVNARPLEGGRPTVAYTARFCLKAAEDATLAVVVIGWDEARGRWRDEAC